ncbi:MAG: ABC transporter ATP-binding protein [Planctomycetes bacterium]|nr:ABC transporter ATP-binding protein [Planctomycetota bacterium]
MVCPLEVQGVKKCFCQGNRVVRALDGVNLKIEDGEFVAVMGASGSGKSTLLHAMAGLTNIDAGRVLVEGQDLSRLSDAKLTTFRRKRIGIVFQAFNLIPVLSAEENVRLPAVSTDGLDAKVNALLTQLGMADRRTHKPQALSGGEQQRTAIARALIGDPAILLLDEPTGSLDSVAGQELCQTLRDLCDKQHRTIVMVTHEASVAMWADRVVTLRDGKAVDAFSTKDCDDALALAHRYRESTQVKRTVGGQL